jgi:hypothetical protein
MRKSLGHVILSEAKDDMGEPARSRKAKPFANRLFTQHDMDSEISAIYQEREDGGARIGGKMRKK